MSPITPAQDWKLHDIEVALRDAFPHFQNGEPITAAAIERIGNDISAGCIFPSRGPRGWRAGLSHDQLIKVLQAQLELEKRFKADDERRRTIPIWDVNRQKKRQ